MFIGTSYQRGSNLFLMMSWQECTVAKRHFLYRCVILTSVVCYSTTVLIIYYHRNLAQRTTRTYFLQVQHCIYQIFRKWGVVEHCVVSLVPRLPGTRNVHAWRAWYLFSHDHDVIEIGPEFLEQKGNVLRVIQPTLRSMLGVYDIRPPPPPIARYV